MLGQGQPSAGVRVSILMTIVILAQPLAVLAGRWLRNRGVTVVGSLVAMTGGGLALPVGGGWIGLVLLGAGFGVFVVSCTAWVKELAPPGQAGRSLGRYGFGSALGGAVGAPLGLVLAGLAGLPGVIIGAAVLAVAGAAPVLGLADRDSRPKPDGTTRQYDQTV